MVKVDETLADLGEGQVCKIRNIADSGPVSRRLMDMGFLPGASVRVMRRGPFGDPTTYFIRGYLIGLRRQEASLVRISSGLCENE